MKINPLNKDHVVSESTIEIKPIVVRDDMQESVQPDPSGILNNSVFALIRVLKIKSILLIGFAVLLWFGAIALALADYYIIETEWFAYILPVIIFLLTSWKLFHFLLEYHALKRDVRTYRHNVIQGQSSTPPFIVRLYKNLHINQVAHNWNTFFIFFYGGTSLILFYFLKDQNFWIFHFDTWIHSAFNNVFLVEVIGLCVIVGTVVIHIIFAAFRKRRIYQLDSYFGMSIVDQTALGNERARWNKFYRRIFYVSLIIIFVIPLLVWVILRLVRKR